MRVPTAHRPLGLNAEETPCEVRNGVLPGVSTAQPAIRVFPPLRTSDQVFHDCSMVTPMGGERPLCGRLLPKVGRGCGVGTETIPVPYCFKSSLTATPNQQGGTYDSNIEES